MFKFFTPTTKVQKDRAIMRETDARLAKYSRRGLIFNFVAFLLCLTGGSFVEKQQGLAIVLTVGLLLVTLLRGFFLFRFDTLYPRAPAKWRDNYFMATLLGATWWGFILVSITLVLQMRDVAPLLWLYTVVFFSTTAHAFAPYQRFLTVYQFVGQIPAAVAALFIPDISAWLYAILLIAFYLMLVHQCRLMSDDYWQRLAATFALAKKTETLEEEKRGTRATVQLNQEFINNLHADLGEVVQRGELGLNQAKASSAATELVEQIEQTQGLQQRILASVEDFRGLLNKELTLESRVFNIRHELQSLIAEVVDDAEHRQVEVESALSPTIPMRLEGDASRYAQIIRTILESVLHNANNAFILIEADFLREFETSGDLQVTVSRQAHGKKHFFLSESEEGINGSLDLSVCKGLAESMDGTLTVVEDEKGSHQIRFRAKFTVPEKDSAVDFHKPIFNGHSILVVHHNPALIEVKRRELDALGFSVRTESQYRRAYQTLVHSYRENAPIECVLFYLRPNSAESLEFGQSLFEHKELRNTHQLIACAENSRDQVREIFKSGPCIHTVTQPAGLYELGMALYGIYANEAARDNLPEPVSLHILLVDTQESSGNFGADHLQLTGAEVDVVKMQRLDVQQLGENDYHLIVMECRTEHSNCAQVIEKIRQFEKNLNKTALLPIIGVGWGKVSNFYELGFDHYLDLNEQSASLDNTLHYWAGR